MTSYSSDISVGDRRNKIAVFTTATLGGGNMLNLINGSVTDDSTGSVYWTLSSAATEIVFYFFEAEVVIDEVIWKQSATSSHGTWQWEGSNDGSSYTNIGSTFTLGGSTSQTQTTLNGNTTAYKYYRLTKVSGTRQSTPWLREIEFKADIIAASPYSYSTPISSGDRTSLITITNLNTITNGTYSNLIDGAFGNTNADSIAFSANSSPRWIQFALGADYIVKQFKWYQSLDSGHGTWQFQGSLDGGSTWVNIGATFTLGIGTGNWYNHIYQNAVAYPIYRLLFISGTTSNSPWIQEMEFLAYAPPPPDTTAWDTIYSVGDRRDLIAVKSTAPFNNGHLLNLIDGGFGNNTTESVDWSSSSSAMSIIFYFFEAELVIDEAILRQSTSDTHGTWQWAGSNNGSSWTNIGSTFTLGGATEDHHTELNGNTNAYKYYRLEKTSGSTNSTPWLEEFEFKVGITTPATYAYDTAPICTGDRSTVITVDNLGTMSGGPVENLVNGDFSNNGTGSTDFSSGTDDRWIEFDFGSNGYAIKQAKFYQSVATLQGTWQWEGWDSANWLAIGDPFELGDGPIGTSWQNELSDNIVAFTKYRLIRISGSTDNTPWLQEIEFIALEGIPPEPSEDNWPTSTTQYLTTLLDANEGPTATTQYLVNAVEVDSTSGINTTQFFMNIVALEQKPTLTTQYLAQNVYLLEPTDVAPMMPQWPVVERWSFMTTLSTAKAGYEQRMALREDPEIVIDYSVPLIDDEQRAQAFYTMYRYGGSTIQYPLYQYMIRLGVSASMGDLTIAVNATTSNLRVGELAYLLSPDAQVSQAVRIASISDSPHYVEFEEPLAQNVDEDWFIVPMPLCRLQDSGSMSLDTVGNGTLELRLTVIPPRLLLRPNQRTDLVTLFGTDLMLPDKWTATSDASEMITRDREEIGGVSNRQFTEAFYHPQRVTPRRFFVEKEGLDYWRAWAARVNGRRSTFLMPSFRNDLWLSETPALGATRLMVSNNEISLYMRSESNRWLRIERMDGSVIYRRVSQALMQGDGIVRLDLTASIGSSPGNNQFRRISLMSRCRLESDEIVLEHNVNHIELSFSVRTVEG